ncbi:IS110 family transposase [Caldicellulosiruptor acetigenus]|uniref:Transposase IS116/IS110/IS902 family protein n=1 Tax=Caldicellulosiruptor acetigenus 6A TaxID=632516 RepID=G2PXX8_9FIRM|nr:IS110 family transposase [Caldicellulosiruptor acetigenus]AEM74845.1 transposase IS116/IS110/IS902 family protein [Caldicellulosiruptor acetigenus 6A]
MKYTQNEKILQVTEKTLVVGVDIAKERHVGRAFDFRGVELGKRIEFENRKEGMEKFLDWANKIMKANGKEKVIVGIEPTGHYWLCFEQYLRENGIKVVLVNPFHVKRSKELDDNTQTKSDIKDPKTIAMLVKDGRYTEPNIPEGIYAEMRVAMNIYERLQKQLNVLKNQIINWLDIYFPEFLEVFSDWEGKTAIATLREMPLPCDVVEKEVEGIIEYWHDKVDVRAISRRRAMDLVETAKRSIGKKEGRKLARLEIKYLLEEYELLKKQIEEIECEMAELLREVPNGEQLLEIKGVGVKTAVGFISEVGDIRKYEDGRQIQKLAGLNIIENRSGKYKGQTCISKRGRGRLRSSLFKAMITIVAKNEEFKQLHRYYTTRQNNPLKKKQSLIALCCKLIRIFFAILKKGMKYDGNKMLSDIKREVLARAA